MKANELAQFEKYHAAVGAERYRVTAIKMRESGPQKVFILDKKDGVTIGFTPDEIAQRTPELKRLQARGENIYYTPMSADKHHILIDDLDRAEVGSPDCGWLQTCGYYRILARQFPSNHHCGEAGHPA